MLLVWISILIIFVIGLLLYFLFKKSRSDAFSLFVSKDDNQTPIRKVCIFAYYEKDETYRQNLVYFLDHGVYPDMHYLIVVNGRSTIPMVETSNVRYVQRKNIGFDFGGYAHGLSLLSLHDYDYFFFLNSSVRGPFVHPGEDISQWTDRFLRLFKEDIHLVGATINLFTWDRRGWNAIAHVQSYCFVLDRPAVDLLSVEILSTSHLTRSMWETITKKEIKMSQIVLDHGWNISCTAEKYQGYDYRKVPHNFNRSSFAYGGDPCYSGAYFGGTLKAKDVVFIKTNRKLPIPLR